MIASNTIPTEQAYLHRWATATFGERPALGTLAALAVRRTAEMLTAIIAGEREESIHQMALVVIALYRIASAYGVELWDVVSHEINDLIANEEPHHDRL